MCCAKRDDVENKINNKFCMQQHYETIANPTTCLSLLLSTLSYPTLFPLLSLRCLRAWADKLQLVFLLRAQHGVCVIRPVPARLPGCQRCFFMASFDLCTIKCHKMKLNKRNVKLIYTYRLQFLSANLPFGSPGPTKLIEVTDNIGGFGMI